MACVWVDTDKLIVDKILNNFAELVLDKNNQKYWWFSKKIVLTIFLDH